MIQPAWKHRPRIFASVGNALKLISMGLLFTSACWAQLPQAGDTTSPPTPGVGHDYIHSPVETMNPANGSVSIRIPVRIPPGRELTIPFAVAYDSSGAFYYGSQNGGAPSYLTTTNVPFTQGGWSYPFPQITYTSTGWYAQTPDGKNVYCSEKVNYVFQDPTGNRHNLGLGAFDSAVSWAQYCGASSSILQGGEGPILATTGGFAGSAIVTNGNGTVYSGTTITDRNGNTASIAYGSTSATVTDTAGRTALSIPTFGSNPDNISVAGLSSAYKVYWTTASASFNISVDNLGTAACPTSLANSAKVISQIVLPNGQSYTFSYNSTYGMLGKITYPSGGYVRYVWGLNSQSESGLWTQGVPGGYWDCRYDFPAITDRYVSLDGTTEVLHQHFSYSTSWQSGSDQWTSKTTTVTTTDLVRGTSFNTVYTYSPVVSPCQPDLNPNGSGCVGNFTQQMPVEQTIQYYDTNGHLLKTVGKTWCNNDPRELCSATTTLNDTNQVSEVTYSYNSNEEQTERDEYDYGSGGRGALTRKTVTNYASFTGAHIVDLPSSVITYDGSGNRVAETDSSYDQTGLQTTSVVQHTTAPGGSARGNLTTVTKQCFNGACAGGNPTTTYSYYDTGQIYQTTDPKGNVTTFSYTDSYSSCGGNAPPSGATDAYLTQVTYPQTSGVNHVESYCYDYLAGLLRGSTDENGQTSSYTYSDSLDRLTQANYPDGGETIVSYNDTPPTPSVTTEKKLDTSGRFITSVSITDGMGLPIETELTSDPQGTDFTVTSYDGLGRIYTVTNPYRSTSDPTYGVTTYAYDALDRTTSVTKPDSSVVSTTYSGNCTTVTDEAGKNRESCTDGLGRMTSVIENPGGLGYTTNYTYDTLDDLTSVVQGGSRNRSFTFDSLKRMTQSTNPESGTINYAYDLNGNVSTKTDARSITTTYSYDALNRVTGMTYSNGDHSVSYTYDQSACLGQSSCYNIGHRTTMTDVDGSEEFAYDTMGREIAEQRTTTSVTKSTSYTYDLAGNMLTLTYPSGRTITYAYDSAGRPAEAADTANNINYVLGSCSDGVDNDGVCYAPNGSVAQVQNGTNLVSTYIYNKRFQPCWMYATTGTALATSTTCTANDPGPGNILDLQYNFNLGSGDNGNVVGITNKRDSTRTQSFTYDALNRVVTAKTSATSGSNCWGETYTIDEWANLTAIGALSGYSSCTQENLSVSATTSNQLSFSGSQYDAAGNMLADGANSYAYNAESEIKSAAGVTYTYDGDGNRLEKSSGKIYWYGAGTEILDESDTSGNFSNEYVFFGGKRVAMRVVSSGTIYYYEDDMLGSARTMVQAGQTAVCYDADFYPFGGERDIVSTCGSNYKFEGKERDTETGNDDFGARYYTSRLGRWLSADWSSVPAPVPYANLTNPQTLNLYAMVSDNPETFADLDGHCGAITLPGAPPQSCSDAGVVSPNNVATQGEGQQPQPQKTGDGQPIQQVGPDYIPPGGVETLGVTAGRINNETNGMKDSKNENMSLSEAEKLMAHARFGAEREYGKNVQRRSHMIKPLMSGPGYKRALAATIAAAREDLKGIDSDPTHGATHYNMRTPAQAAGMGTFEGTRVSTVSGPYISPSPFKYIVTYSNNYGPWP
jgi:RHS repeat-associated protein